MLIYACTFLAVVSLTWAFPTDQTKPNENQDLSKRIDENARLIETLHERLEQESKLTQQLLKDNAELNIAVAQLKALQANDIAFYVHMPDGSYPLTDGSIVQYDQIVTNLGNGYNSASGSFTALQHGYYVFTMFFETDDSTSSELAILVNDVPLCVGDGAGEFKQGTCSAIVELHVGDVVNVKAIYGDVVLYGGDSGKVNGFAGYIYAPL